jgi:formylglycine-generating enzyme required for sulfatase activity
MSWRHAWLLLPLAAMGACGPPELPPLGEVLIVVDTDAPVPGLVGQLRVDAYTAEGTWYSSRDFLLEEVAQWPASFGVYSSVPNRGGNVILRLRAFADGNVRDYLGERYQARPTGGPPSQIVPTPSPPPGMAPRLLSADGSDITPTTEPEPLLAIDRLVELSIPPNVVQSAHLVLRGACFGTMADLATHDTCLDTENTLVPVSPAVLGADLTAPSTSLEGTFGTPTPCTAMPRGPHDAKDGTPLYDEEVCVGGGTFVFGSFPDLAPERIVTATPFLIDKYEVTVGYYRDAIQHGLAQGQTPLSNDAPFPFSTDFDGQFDTPFCTYSDQPLGREDYPLSCIAWTDARAFCQFEGGDLASEVQFEWVAAAAARANKTLFPWGGPDVQDVPCSQGIFGRGYTNLTESGPCITLGLGPASVDEANHGSGDVSVGFGIVDVGYNVSEWLLDSYDELDTRCWLEQPLAATSCEDPANGLRSIRGGAWAFQGFSADYSDRTSSPPGEVSTLFGFRCVRKAAQ